MDRHLLGYLPTVLKDVLEFQTINEANEPEISLAWDTLTRVLANQFLEDADENGVAMWERELKIYPKDTDTLETRKARIKAMWNLKLPYTVSWLRNWLAGLCGPTGYELMVAEYTINIRLDFNALSDANLLATEILNMLLSVRPSNMRVLMTMMATSTSTIYTGIAARQGDRYRLAPVVCSGYRQNPVYCGIAPRQGDRYQLRPLSCGPLRRDPVRVGMVMRQADKIIVKQVNL